MCLAVYIASNKPLPLISWVEEKPAFYVGEISKNEAAVKKQFKYQYIYYAGSHEGCGCGFFKDGEVGEDLAQVEVNYRDFSAYLKKAKESGASIQIFSCWEGDQTSELEYNEEISEESLNEKQFEFKEKALYQII
jgi:hypothetical protein